MELNVFNMCKQPHDVKDEDNENEEIELIEEHIQDEIFTNSMEICFSNSFESSKKSKYNAGSIALYLILHRFLKITVAN